MRRAALLAVGCVALVLAVEPVAAAAARSPLHWRPLGRHDLVYKGAFRLPGPVDDKRTFSYGGTAIAYNPLRHSLFAVGHDWYQLIAEVSIPKLAHKPKVGQLHRAHYLQGFTEATDGAIDRTGGDGNKLGGMLVQGGRLFGSVYVYYDASGSQVVSHWARPSTSLRAGTAKGLSQVGKLGAGMVSGFITQVPTRWRDRLGGPALTGNCCIPIISRTSFGPAAFAFDPARIGSGPVPDRPLVYYPQDHTTIGAWDASWNPKEDVFFGGGTTVRGVVFPRHTRSVLFFGTQGIGRFCYGEGTENRALDGKPTPDGTTWCYDPDDSSKGTHAYPYVPEVWAYDAGELAAVAARHRKPWSVKPYATWKLTLPYGSPRIGGAAYDGKAGTIYVSQQYADDTQPVIHAFKVR